MADEATDVQSSEITLDDFNADEQESTKAESSAVKTEEPEAKAEESKAEAAKTDEAKTPEAKDTEDKPEEQSEAVEETNQPTRADERKTKLSTEIRDLVATRNALKEEVAKANSEVYQPATEQELTDEGLSATDAKVEALRQQIEVRDYNERVADAQLTIESESQRILNDFAWSNPDSPDYKKELSEEAAQLLQANLVTDSNTGQIIGSNISPYQLYKTLDRASGISQVQGQLKGQQDTEKMLANADTASSAPPPQKAKDPLMELWKSDD